MDEHIVAMIAILKHTRERYKAAKEKYQALSLQEDEAAEELSIASSAVRDATDHLLAALTGDKK